MVKPIYTEPVNVTDGDPFTRDMWNNYVEQNLYWLLCKYEQVYARVYFDLSGGSQTLTANVANRVPLEATPASDEYGIIKGIDTGTDEILLDAGVYRIRVVLTTFGYDDASQACGIFWANRQAYISKSWGKVAQVDQNRGQSNKLETIRNVRLDDATGNGIQVYAWESTPNLNAGYISSITVNSSQYYKGSFVEIWQLPEDDIVI